jgi:hypothetical protein
MVVKLVIPLVLGYWTLDYIICNNGKNITMRSSKLPYLPEEIISHTKKNILTVVSGYALAFIILSGMFVGIGSGVKSFLNLSLKYKFIVILLSSFQYVSIWTTAVLINKSQVHRDLVNAINTIIDLTYSDEISLDNFMEAIKYTNFRRGTMLKFMDYYIYIPHPRYEQWLKQCEHNENSQSHPINHE